MRKLLILGMLAAALTGAEKPTLFESPDAAMPQGKIDDLVFAQWKRLSIQPARLCSDAVFVRRAYLDTIGTLPTAEEAASFLADTGASKRSALIDRLLERDEFAEYWAMKWSDLLRIKAEFPINLWPNAAQAYYNWVRSALRANQPYDQFARELLTASGSNFRVAPVNFYRAMQNKEPRGIAQTVALTFLGSRFEKWPADRQAGMAAFFSHVGYKETGEWKEEIVYFDPARKTEPNAAPPSFPDGTPARIAAGQDPREVFAAWLVAPGNPWFARAIVNRIWYWLLGRGIVQEPDDFRADNPPENPELLAYLTQELVASHYDLKQVYSLILHSSTWQLSSIPRAEPALAAAHFASYPLRRLDAEVLIDALNQVTGTSETYTSAIPEPYTFMPDFQRAIALPDGSISSSFLEEFGRPPRDTGTELERNSHITDSQRLHMLNSSHVQRKIQQSPRLQAMMRDIRNPQELVKQVYLTILSRPPSDEEWKLVAAHSQNGNARGQAAVVDLVWALFNSTEFLYRH
ncbi:conserved exported hypothetical protein [Candidatus Sulfopaludibacter sp. SbA3]|nr:conserved exported hypothetical protein [Candidatus Sulfopaludibacter sp. SbA3]